MRSREEIINDSKHLGVQELSKLILEVLLDIRDLYGQRQKDVWPGIANIPPSELLEAFAKMRDQKRRVKTPEESARAVEES